MSSNVHKYGLLTIKTLLTFAFVTAGGAKLTNAPMPTVQRRDHCSD